MSAAVDEDLNLSNNLLKLEIDKASNAKIRNFRNIQNPFMRKRSKSLSCINFGARCGNCSQTIKHTVPFKKGTNNRKILREPILKYVKCLHNNNSDCKVSKFKATSWLKRQKDRLFGHGSHNDKDFKTILDGCELLSVCDFEKFSSPSFLNARSATPDQYLSKTRNHQKSDNLSCSTQARMNAAPPCDVTIDELASYFETLVHIPKKMSSMAEMMYI